ncbi:MAG: hypothetical protein H6627_08815 [Calditrichae bacterium]|nr:hypothetical protein [Calditrichia bacterium]
MILIRYIILFVSLLSISLTAQAFDGFSLGMAGNYTAISRGVEAIAWNPANLSMYRSTNFEMNFIAANAALFNSSLSVNDYNTYFTTHGHNGYWSDSDKKQILNSFSGDGLRMNMDFATNVFGIAAGNFGFGIQLIGNGQAQIRAGKPLEIFLFGETIETDYSFKEKDVIDASMFSAVKNSIAYSYLFRMDRSFYSISHLAIGGSFNYYLGLTAAITLASTVSMNRVDLDGLNSDEELFRYETHLKAQTADPGQGIAGTGMGIDLGITARFARAWHFSLAFSNLFGSINWYGHTQFVDYGQVDSVFIRNSKPDTHNEFETKVEGKSFRTSLPVQMRMGLSLRMLADLKLSMDYHQGLNTAFGNSTVPRVGFGAEYKIFNWLPVRSGFAAGGKEVFLFGTGFGIHAGPIALDFSYAMCKAILPVYSNGVFTSFSFKLLL